jgi:hypothetical protein
MNPLPMCRNFRSIELHKKHITKFRDTIPLTSAKMFPGALKFILSFLIS